MALNLNDYFDEEEERLANGQQPVVEQEKEKVTASVDLDGDDEEDYIEPRSARRKRRIRLIVFAVCALIAIFVFVKGFLVG